MPHECTNCGRTFADGSKEMLSGCPDCGGNKFQFAPSGRATSGSGDSSEAAAATTTETADGSSPEQSDSTATGESTGTVERAAETVRGWVSSNSSEENDSARASQADASRTSQADGTRESTTSRTESSSRTDETEQAWPEADETEQAWPEADETAPSDSNEEPGEFSEWPETARRPEDRSTPPADDSSETDRRPPAVDSSGTGGDQSRSGTPDRSDPSATDPAANGSVDERTRATIADSENSAQADARTEVVSTDDLPSGTEPSQHSNRATGSDQPAAPGEGEPDQPPDHGRVVSEPSGEQPSIEELRAELNEQFESIKIVSPGQYELNLMELYNREEYIISLQEDGRYVIDVPDSWRADDDE